MITLYHGTIHDFDAIDVGRGRLFKDFGRGFYATEDHNHAIGIARRNQGIEFEREALIKRKSDILMFVYTYTFDVAGFHKLNVKQFPNPGAEWVDFVVRNRSERSYRHSYDLIIGATANDDTRITIQQYLLGAYGDVGTDEAINGFLRQIKAEKLPMQWLFATKRAVEFLRLKDKRKIL
ncbi:MAG: DUF3990 domain-containing protein [Peptococcaceae bacterium]|jgi:hypothetical protein|nr:DUF3990 domain-containing protein [Peptococcaceae bacterium]